MCERACIQDHQGRKREGEVTRTDEIETGVAKDIKEPKAEFASEFEPERTQRVGHRKTGEKIGQEAEGHR